MNPYMAYSRKLAKARTEKVDPLLPVDMNALQGRLLRGNSSYLGGVPNPTGKNQWTSAVKAAMKLRKKNGISG